MLAAPRVALEVPAGHAVALIELKGQKYPDGQMMGVPEKQ